MIIPLRVFNMMPRRMMRFIDGHFVCTICLRTHLPNRQRVCRHCRKAFDGFPKESFAITLPDGKKGVWITLRAAPSRLLGWSDLIYLTVEFADIGNDGLPSGRVATYTAKVGDWREICRGVERRIKDYDEANVHE